MIDRYDPARQMMSLRQMMDRLFEDAFIMPREGQVPSQDSAPLNVYEEGDNLVVEAQMPGVRPEDVEITAEGGMLTIRGHTKAEQERKDRNYLIREHREGIFVRSLRLPETVDADRAQASFDNGVLRLTFPKSAQAKPRRIAITPGEQQARAGGTQGSLQQGSQQQGSRQEEARQGGSRQAA